MSGLRVAYVVGTVSGGTGEHVAMLARGCRDRGLAVTVFGPARTGERFSGIGAAFVPLEVGERPRPVRDARSVLRLRHLLARSGTDVVHAHGLRAGAFAALALVLPVHGSRVPLAVTVHNAPPGRGAAGAVYAALERVVARRADAVTCVSGDLVARMHRLGAAGAGLALVPARRAGAPDGPAVAAARAAIADAGGPVVLAVGRLAPQKGFATLLAAAAHWQGRDPRPVVALAGRGPLEAALRAGADAGGIRVRFLGQRADVPALLAGADVVVVPSLWEGQPLIVQEALHAGRPLVASRTGGIPALTGPDAAVLVPPGDAAALAEAVLAVLDDPALAAKLAAAARGRAVELPTQDDAVEAAVGLYRRLAGPVGQR